LPPRLRVATGDRRRVEQILTNLAGNALKFTGRDGHVEIAAEVRGLTAIFAVRDDGDGIPQDDRSRIFERFQRMAGHDRVAGTGLGLPIARDLARRMHGELDVASVPGAGSTFVLVLPGPADVDDAVVEAAMAEALEREEVALEERLVRQAIQAVRFDSARAAASDDDSAGAETAAVRQWRRDDETPHDAETATDPAGRRGGPVRLRALPSLGPGERAPA
jgi:histidine kinase/DNA gyrase B/HSP90-like ATPase